MEEKNNIIKKKYSHIVLEGTSYEVGKQQGELIKNIPSVVKRFTSSNPKPKKMGFKDFEEMKHQYEQYCPGIIDEFHGIADVLDSKLEKLSFFTPPIYQAGHCSQMAAMSSVTKEKHVLVGRSYEFNQTMNDFTLRTLKIKNKVSHIGFSEFMVFRDEGMNDHGLSVTFTNTGIDEKKVKEKKRGYAFFLIVRSILENCKTVQEASDYLKSIPVSGFWNFLIADKESNAVLYQFFNDDYAVKKVNNETEEKILFSGNHNHLTDMVKYQKFAFGPWILKNSRRRYELIQKTLTEASPNITIQTLKQLLSKELYQGLCGHYYDDFFGTLFSIIFDLTDLTAKICFGPPTHNDWYVFTFDDPVGVKTYDAVLPNKSIKEDELFHKQ
jgi:predicted choloylglycine hydrolase